MSDGSVGRNENPEKIMILIGSDNCVSLFIQDAPQKIKLKYCTLTLQFLHKLQIFIVTAQHQKVERTTKAKQNNMANMNGKSHNEFFMC